MHAWLTGAADRGGGLERLAAWLRAVGHPLGHGQAQGPQGRGDYSSGSACYQEPRASSLQGRGCLRSVQAHGYHSEFEEATWWHELDAASSTSVA